MRRCLRFSGVLLLWLAGCGGTDPAGLPAAVPARELLEIGFVDAFTASPDGRLWIRAEDGRNYRSSDWNQTWSEVSLPNHGGWLPCYFDAKHALLPQSAEVSETSAILRTDNDGLTWASVALPVTGVISDVRLEPSGTAWLASQSGGILSSTDFGRTWRTAGMPFESSDGTASVRFRSADQGFAGSYSNGLKQTTDGGRSWTSLVTPADELCPPNPESTEEIPEPLPMQGKDGKSVWRSFSGDQDSRVDCLQIIGDRLLVRQREQVFERPLSSRGGWRLLEVDGRRIVSAVPNEDGLVVVTEDRRVALLARDLLSLYPS